MSVRPYVIQQVSRMQVDIQERTKQELEKKSVTEDKLEEKVTSWEFKTKSQLKEIHNNIQALQTESQAKQKKLKQELAHTMEQLHGQNQQKQVTNVHSSLKIFLWVGEWVGGDSLF